MTYYPIFLAIVLALVFRYATSRRTSATEKKIVIGLTATTTLMLIVDDHNETDRQMSMRSPPTNVTSKPDGDGEAN